MILGLDDLEVAQKCITIVDPGQSLTFPPERQRNAHVLRFDDRHVVAVEAPVPELANLCVGLPHLRAEPYGMATLNGLNHIHRAVKEPPQN